MPTEVAAGVDRLPPHPVFEHLRPESPSHPEASPLLEDDGSLVTEYGLIAVLAATIVGLVLKWAANGNIYGLFDAILTKARSLVGA